MAIIVDRPRTIIRVQKPDKIVVVTPNIKIVKIPMGPPGPKGDTGAAGGTLEFVVSVPATTWVIPHNMGKRPAGWTIYDSGNTIYEAGAEFLDVNTMRFTFSAAISGRVVLV